jgi:hypothetical protein
MSVLTIRLAQLRILGVDFANGTMCLRTILRHDAAYPIESGSGV